MKIDIKAQLSTNHSTMPVLSSDESNKACEDLKQETDVDMHALDDEIKTLSSHTNSIVASIVDNENRDTDQKSRLQQKIELSISHIGKAFYDSSKYKYESNLIFKDISELETYGLLFLPGIVGGLCKRIVDLEKMRSDGNKSEL